MKGLLVALGLLLSVTTIAQRPMHAEDWQGQTENFWRSYLLKNEQEVELKDVAVAAQPFYLRLWMGGTVIDIWESKGAMQGSLLKWVKEKVPSGEVETGRLYMIKEKIDSAVCRKLYQAYHDRRLDVLPSEEKISGWQEGFDGAVYILETVKDDAYYLKSYWAPEVQSELREAALVRGFVDDVVRLLDLRRRSYFFDKGIPFESWTYAGGQVVSRTLTSEAQLKMKKERNRYRRLAKPSANAE